MAIRSIYILWTSAFILNVACRNVPALKPLGCATVYPSPERPYIIVNVHSLYYNYTQDPPTFLCRGFCPPDPLGAGFNVNWDNVSLNQILQSLDRPVQVCNLNHQSFGCLYCSLTMMWSLFSCLSNPKPFRQFSRYKSTISYILKE